MNINELIELYAQTPTYFNDVFAATLPQQASQSLQTRHHNRNYLLLPLSGQAIITVAATTYSIQQGYVLHVGNDEKCHIDVIGQQAFHYIVIQYEVLRAENVLNMHYLQPLDNVARCQHYAQQMLALATTPGSYALLQSQTLYMQFIEEFLASAKRTTLTAKSEVVSLTIAFMHEHYANDVSMAQLAERVGIERRRFSEVFEATIGMNPSQYLMELRIRKAKEQLRDEDTSIAVIGERVGYYDCFYFSRVFKKCTGVSPSLYRKTYSQLIMK